MVEHDSDGRIMLPESMGNVYDNNIKQIREWLVASLKNIPRYSFIPSQGALLSVERGDGWIDVDDVKKVIKMLEGK